MLFVQEKVDEALQEALVAEVGRCVHSALQQAWAPDEPLPDDVSSWMDSLVGTLEVCPTHALSSNHCECMCAHRCTCCAMQQPHM